MKKPIRITGYIDQADVLEPIIQIDKNDIFHEKEPLTKYRLWLMTTLGDAYDIESEINHQVTRYIVDNPMYKSIPPQKYCYQHGLIFESLRPPRLEGELKNAESDLDLHGKYVQVVGYVQHQELGNCFLSFHIVEPAVHPANGLDR